MNTLERLKKIRAGMNLTQSDFAISINMKREAYASVEIGKANMTQTMLNSLLEVYNININWLLTGTGNKFVENIHNTPTPITSEVTPIDFGDKIHNVIELQEGALAANFISLDDASRHRAAVPAYMPGLPLSADPYYSLRVKGDSMTPVLNNGDWLFAALLPPDEAYSPNAQTAYVIALDGVFLVKWLRFHAPDAHYAHGSYEFVSANTAYPPYREPAERINAVLRVVAVLKPL